MSKQISLILDPNSAATLARMEALTNEDTKYVIQNALRLYLWLVEAEEKGQELLLRDPKNGVTTVKVFEPIRE